MKGKLRLKIIIMVIIIIIILIITTLNKKNIVFVKSTNDIKLIEQSSLIKKSDIILEAETKDKVNITSNTLNDKYTIIKNEDANVCAKRGRSFLVQRNKKFNVIAVEIGNSYEYYKENNGVCSRIALIENVTFSSNLIEAYANDSIYTSFESLDNFELSGMIKLTSEDQTTLDSLNKRYTNPLAIEKGVLLLENRRSLVAFNKDNKLMFKQNNSFNNRNIFAVNTINDSLFVLLKKSNKIILEGYKLSDEKSIINTKPLLSYDVTKLFNKVDYNVNIKNSNKYASFTFASSSLVVSEDFSKVYAFRDVDTMLGINNNLAYIKAKDKYSVVDLDTNEIEFIGSAMLLNFRANNDNAYFSVFDNQRKEISVKYTTR